MAIKLAEQTDGNHIYMRLRLDNKRIEEIDVYIRSDGSEVYQTSADHGMELDPVARQKNREDIIQAFEELY